MKPMVIWVGYEKKEFTKEEAQDEVRFLQENAKWIDLCDGCHYAWDGRGT